MPIGRIIDLNHWGVLQVCLLQCPPFQTSNEARIADPREPSNGRLSRSQNRQRFIDARMRGRAKREYPCPDRGKLVEEIADAFFDYAYWCHTYAEMDPMRAAMERALESIEYVLYVFLRLRQRHITLTDPRLQKKPHDSTANKAFEAVKSLVQQLKQEDYAKMTQVDVQAFVRAGLLPVLNDGEAKRLGYTPRDPATIVGPMRIGPHLEWLEQLYTGVYGTGQAGRTRWRETLKDALILRIYYAFLRYRPPKYPNVAILHAIAEILVRFGLEEEDSLRDDIAERLRKRLPSKIF